MQIYALIISTTLVLLGCGGGGGGGSNSGGSSSPASSSSTAVSSKSTADLDVPFGFDYRTEIPGQIHITLVSMLEGEHYLSVYSRYQQLEDGTLIPDLSSRIASVPFTGTSLSLEIIFPSVAAPILLELWTRGEAMPLQQVVAISEANISADYVEVSVEL